jgi:hypothetical protein
VPALWDPNPHPIRQELNDMHRIALALTLPLVAGGCAFHSNATQWSERVGPDGHPVFVKSTTNVGLNFLIALKIVGGTDTPGMIQEITGSIAEDGGDKVRIIQSESENYWYGFPPFTWILTPVITTVTADYRPSEDALSKAGWTPSTDRSEEETPASK